jgi:putative hydroxymethylpyrimidine transport system permease protein
MIPTIAIAPVFVLWFGYSIWSKVIVTVLITFFPITVSTFDGLRSTNKELKELMLTMGATKKDIFFKLNIPSALPHFYSGLKVAVTFSIIGAAIGEWLGAQAGLGYFSRRMMTQFDAAGVFAPIVILSALGILFFIIVVGFEKRSLKWRKTE